MRITGIDPGSEKSGVVVYDSKKKCVEFSAHMCNDEILKNLRGWIFTIPISKDQIPSVIAIEDIEHMGLAVGKTTFETCKWIGRFQEAWRQYSIEEVKLISRGDEKIVICGCKTFVDPETGKRKGVSDKQIRQALIDRFEPLGGGKIPQIGTKKQPGPLYGVSKHAWSALSVAITALETME